MAGARRYRSSRIHLLGVVVLAVCTVPLAFASPLLLVLLALPVLAAAFVLRTGTDADADGVTVRAVAGSRTLPWSEVALLTADGGKVYAVTTAGTRVRLLHVTPGDAAALVGSSDGRIRLGAPA